MPFRAPGVTVCFSFGLLDGRGLEFARLQDDCGFPRAVQDDRSQLVEGCRSVSVLQLHGKWRAFQHLRQDPSACSRQGVRGQDYLGCAERRAAASAWPRLAAFS